MTTTVLMACLLSVAQVQTLPVQSGPRESQPHAAWVNPQYVRMEVQGSLRLSGRTAYVDVFYGGGCLFISSATWRLDLGRDPRLWKTAARLNGQMVILTGELLQLPTGFGAPAPMQAIRVRNLREAPPQ